MSHEQASQVGHFELQADIDEAAAIAKDATKRYSYQGSEKRNQESITSFDPLAGDPIHTVIERSNHPWYEDETKVSIHAAKPAGKGQDPYNRAGADYKVKINGQRGAETLIQRTNEKGEVVYTHESKDVQLARRLGRVGARASIRQNTKRSEELRRAA